MSKMVPNRSPLCPFVLCFLSALAFILLSLSVVGAQEKKPDAASKQQTNPDLKTDKKIVAPPPKLPPAGQNVQNPSETKPSAVSPPITSKKKTTPATLRATKTKQDKIQPALTPVAGKIIGLSPEISSGRNYLLTLENCRNPADSRTIISIPPSFLSPGFRKTLLQQGASGSIGVFWLDSHQRLVRMGLLDSHVSCILVPDLLKQFSISP